MGKERRKNRQNTYRQWHSVLTLILLLLLLFFIMKFNAQKNAVKPVQMPQKGMSVHFIDVGQAESILVKAGEHAMLIDAGNYEDREILPAYLREQGVERLDYVIATHPHEDHIGGMEKIVEEFEIDTFLMTDVPGTYLGYEYLLRALEGKNQSITRPLAGDTYILGEASFTIVGPVKKSYNIEMQDKVNDTSVSIRLINGNNSFLLCADLQAEAEVDMADSTGGLRSDVFKANHHGSSDANTEVILDAAEPSYIVIMCGKDNEYGHPHQSALDRMYNTGAKLFRTDLQGSIVGVSDGVNITWNLEPCNNFQAP